MTDFTEGKMIFVEVVVLGPMVRNKKVKAMRVKRSLGLRPQHPVMGRVTGCGEDTQVLHRFTFLPQERGLQ